jgi:transcription initiation factor TFIID subunit 5
MDISITKMDPEKIDEDEVVIYEEIKKRQRKFKLQGHTDSIFGVSISPDKKYVISASYDESIRLWSIHTRHNLVVYKGHFAPVLCVKFSPFS